MAPSWLHGVIEQAAAVDLVKEGGLQDGKFLIRKYGDKKDEYALCVVYKGKPTHHMIKKNAEGVFTINNKSYGDHTSLEGLINHLGTKVQGWPVPLNKPVGSGGGGGGGGGGLSVHDVMDNAAADALLGTGTTGKYLVRRRAQNNSFALSVTYKGKPTHHLMQPDESGVWCVNKKSYGLQASSAEELITALSGPNLPKGWPVQLKTAVHAGGTSSGGTRSSGVGKRPEDVGDESNWVHPVISNPQANKLLATGPKHDGVFVIRARADSTTEFAISVIYKTKPTHHLIQTVGGVLAINTKAVGSVTNLADLVRELRTKRPYWPVPLKEYVMPSGGSSGSSASSAAATKKKAAAEAARKEKQRIERERREQEKREAQEEQARLERERLAREAATSQASTEDFEFDGFETFHDEEDGGVMGFGEIANEPLSPTRRVSDGNNAALRKQQQDEELMAFQNKLLAAANEQNRRKSTTGRSGATAVRRRSVTRQKTHAEIMADIAAAESGAPVHNAAPQTDTPPMATQSPPKRKGKKTHQELMAEFAREEAVQKEAAALVAKAEEEKRVQAADEEKKQKQLDNKTPDPLQTLAKLNQNIPKTEPAWKIQQRQRREQEIANQRAEKEAREKLMQEVAREQAIQQSNVEAMNNVKVSDGLSKWNKKAEPAKTITRRSKTQAQKLEEEQEAHRKAEFEKARRIEAERDAKRKAAIEAKQSQFFKNSVRPVGETLKKFGAKTVPRKTTPRGRGSGTFVNGEWVLEQVPTRDRARGSQAAATFFANSVKDDEVDV